eukprot:gene17935-24337_t
MSKSKKKHSKSPSAAEPADPITMEILRSHRSFGGILLLVFFVSCQFLSSGDIAVAGLRDMAVRNGVWPTSSESHTAPPASAPPTTKSVHISELCYPEDPYGFPQLDCPHTGQAEGAKWIYIPRSGFGFGDLVEAVV